MTLRRWQILRAWWFDHLDLLAENVPATYISSKAHAVSTPEDCKIANGLL